MQVRTGFGVSSSVVTNMKTLAAFVALCLATASSSASEPGWIETYQPLGGLADGGIHVAPVTCIAKFASTDDYGILPMMAVAWPNRPPNDADFDKDRNVASAGGLKIDMTYGEKGGVTSIVLDASGMAEGRDNDRVRESVMGLLECLRRVTPKPP